MTIYRHFGNKNIPLCQIKIDNQFLGILINKRLVSSFSGYATISVMSRLSLWTTFLIKERGRTSFAAFGEGRSKKRPIPVLNANELLKKTRQCYYTKSHGKKCHKKKKYLFSKLAISFFFYCHIFIQKSHKWSRYNGSSNSMHFCQNLCCRIDYMVQLFWKSRDTDNWPNLCHVILRDRISVCNFLTSDY